SVVVNASGSYTFAARVATFGNGAPGGVFHVEVDGADVTGPMTIPDTGWWQTWTTITKAGVPLTAGGHVVRVVEDTNGPNSFGNFNWFSFAAEATPTPTVTVTP